jgi:hypothetical protein
MKAITVEPHKPGSARLQDIPEPDARDGSVLVSPTSGTGTRLEKFWLAQTAHGLRVS